MQTPPDHLEDPLPVSTSAAPDALWWGAHTVVALLFAGVLFVLGIIVIRGEYAFLPIYGRYSWRGITLEGPAAVLLGWSLLAACPAVVAHVFAPSLDRARPAAIRIKQTFGALTLILFVVAFVRHMIG